MEVRVTKAGPNSLAGEAVNGDPHPELNVAFSFGIPLRQHTNGNDLLRVL